MSFVYLPGLSASSDSGDWYDTGCDAELLNGGGCIVRQSSRASAFCSSKSECTVNSAGVPDQNGWIKDGVVATIRGVVTTVTSARPPAPSSSPPPTPDETSSPQPSNPHLQVATIFTQVVSNGITFNASIVTPIAESAVNPSIRALETGTGGGGGAATAGGLGGAALGAAVGLPLLAIAAIGGAAALMFLRRRKRKETDSKGALARDIRLNAVGPYGGAPNGRVDGNALSSSLPPATLVPPRSISNRAAGADPAIVSSLHEPKSDVKAAEAGAAGVSLYPEKRSYDEVFTWDKDRIMDWLRALQFPESIVMSFYENEHHRYQNYFSSPTPSSSTPTPFMTPISVKLSSTRLISSGQTASSSGPSLSSQPNNRSDGLRLTTLLNIGGLLLYF
ncbi:hypothetical protein BC829DRAFT_446673 [Chytridium lagenaria]|nr:hypothetical protein BC829DRAFT_446673 [Chytridium lagenaria]